MENLYKRPWGLLFLIVTLIIFGSALLNNGWPNSFLGAPTLPEVEELSHKNLSFKEVADYFKNLSLKKGAEYAYQVLRTAPLTPNTDLHLLGHVIGDVLYKQGGLNGIRVCTQEFRNACSHSIVIGLFLDKGEKSLPDVAEACRRAPGGVGAYSLCFHGLGHGILAYTGYDMPIGIDLCKKTATQKYNSREAIECIGGTVMEIIGGGFHDRELWEKQSKKYLSSLDPLSLCKNDFIPSEARRECYIYLTPQLFSVAGAKERKPGPKDFEKAFSFCDTLPAGDLNDRTACYGGFGKEFVVLVQDRDIRKIEQMSQEQLKKIYGWCTLANEINGIKSCLASALNSLFWGGENDVSVAVRFCTIVPDINNYKEGCFERLIGTVKFYKSDQDYRKNFCLNLPQQYSNSCKSRLITDPLKA